MTKTEWRKGDYLISIDKNALQLELIARFLSEESYWSKGISKEDVEKSIQHSAICFGMYYQDQLRGERIQIGFARVITDLVTFAYLTDVFIVKEHRGKGLGKWLLETITSYEPLHIRRIMLNTDDGHSFYEEFGFEPLDKPHLFMQIKGIGAF
ncbi:GNAT family N-acetyltransferase [Halalkalibacterium ligniniphilum]|uniref:GNAT family N-acetyltransferase n=1 Tax=Halalkalibacterium ligniniphilum TaxID=1134413 RepID=UPI000346D284|nr:GNAT family N-acetyltransferase [Halalkalibacterium ligniniphilum]